MNRNEWQQNAGVSSIGGTTLEAGSESPIVPSPIKEVTDRDASASKTSAPSSFSQRKDEVVGKVKGVISTAPELVKSSIEKLPAALDKIPAAIDARPYTFVGISAGVAFGAGILFGSKIGRWVVLLGGGLAVSLLASDRFAEQARNLFREQTRKLGAGKKSR